MRFGSSRCRAELERLITEGCNWMEQGGEYASIVGRSRREGHRADRGVHTRLEAVTVASVTLRLRDIPTEVILAREDGMPTLCALSLGNLGEAWNTKAVTTLSHDRHAGKSAAGAISHWVIELEIGCMAEQHRRSIHSVMIG
jgi:hypothetical protein